MDDATNKMNAANMVGGLNVGDQVVPMSPISPPLPSQITPPTQVGQQPLGQIGRPKEVEPYSAEASKGEVGVEDVVEVPFEVELEKKPELAGYVDAVQKEATVTQAVTDDYTDEILLKPAQQNQTVTLPLTEDQVVQGLHHKVWDSLRWWAEWCVRQIKLLHGKVRYKT